MKCKKCGNKYHKKYIDNNGLCKYCSEDLHFRAKTSIVSRKEWENIRKENEFWENIEYNNHKYNFIPISICAMILATIYLFYWQPLEKAVFIKSVFYIVLVCVSSMILYGISTEIIKPIWLFFVNRIESLKRVKAFTIISILIIAVISALAITLKSLV